VSCDSSYYDYGLIDSWIGAIRLQQSVPNWVEKMHMLFVSEPVHCTNGFALSSWDDVYKVAIKA